MTKATTAPLSAEDEAYIQRVNAALAYEVTRLFQLEAQILGRVPPTPIGTPGTPLGT